MTIKKLMNLSLLVLFGKLILTPCQGMEKEEETSFHTLPNEMVLAVIERIPKPLLSHMFQRKYQRDPDQAMCLRNVLALVCTGWYEKVMEFTDYIYFPQSIGPILIASMAEGALRIPPVFHCLPKLNANNTIPFNKGIIHDILNFTALQVLTINFSNTVKDDVISRLTTLGTLKLVSNRQITDKAIIPLTGLERLKLCHQDKVTKAPFQHLTNLTRLHLTGCFVVTSSSLLNLTSLQTFRLKGTYTEGAQDEELIDPLALRRLGVYVLSETSLTDLVTLPKLTHLTLNGTITVSQQAQALYKGETMKAREE